MRYYLSQLMKTSPEHNQGMQRAKVGITGLAFVILLIGLASAIFSSASREPPVAAIGAAKPDVVANLTMANATDPGEVKEPLAELGVTPSAAAEPTNQAAPDAAHTAPPASPSPAR